MMGGAWMEAWTVDGSAVMEVVLGTGVRGILLLSAVAGLALLLRRGSAARRHLVWSLGMVGLLALPFAEMGAPRWSVELPGTPWVGTEWSEMDRQATDGLGGESAEAGPREGSRGPEGSASATAGSRGVTEGLAATGAVVDARVDGVGRGDGVHGVARVAGSGWPLLLVGIWAVGALLIGGAVLASYRALRRLERSARPFPGGRVARELSHLAVVVGVGRPVRLLEGGEGQMPMSWGLFRPAILLPRGADRWPAARLRAVLLHELAHVQRRDCLTQLVAELARALHWPNPLAWWGVRRLRIEREHACDDRVLRAGARASSYADELLSLARGFRAEREASPAAVAMARPSNLESRLKAVLSEGRRRTLSRRAAAVTAGVTVLLTTAVAGLSAVPAADGLAGDVAWDAPGVDPVERRGSVPAGTSRAADGVVASVRIGDAGSVQEVASCGTAPADWHSSNHRRNDDRTRISWSRPGCEVDILVEGDVEFNATFDDLARLVAGARLRIEEIDGGTERRLEITPGPGGAPRYEYRVDREELPFDTEAREWYEAMLLQVFRRAGFLAEERVAAFLESGGVPAVFQEMERLETDHVYARYVEETIRQADLSEDQSEELLARAAGRVDSDHYLAGILEAVADYTVLSAPMLDTFIEASRRLGSDHYRAEVLETALDRGDLSDPQVRALLLSASEIGSDHYQAEILEGVATRYALRSGLQDAYLRAVARIESSHYLAEVLSSLLERSDLELDDDRIRRIIETSTAIESDHYRSEILIEIAERHPLRGAAREAYVRAMESIESRHYRGRVAEALVSQGG